MKPRCFNREPYRDTVEVRDGWEDVCVGGYWIRAPRIIEIPDPMSKGCQQHGPKGEAKLHGWDCEGCRWKPEEIYSA